MIARVSVKMPYVNSEAESKHISCDIFERGKKLFEFFSMVTHPALMKNCASVSCYFLYSLVYTMSSQLEQLSFCFQSLLISQIRNQWQSLLQ